MRHLALLFAMAGCLAAQEWPQFRGPAGLGVAAPDAKPPVQFGPADKVVWKTALPPGHSSPVIAGDRIFITAAQLGTKKDAGLGKFVDEGGKLFTICLDRRTGKILWQREVPRPRLERYQPTNSPASPSPVTDGRRVYVFFGDFGILAYDLNGKEAWRHPLGPFNNQNGHGSSPVLVDGMLVLLCDQDTDSFLLALDAETGKLRWKTPRPEVTRSYSTPGVLRAAQRTELIVPGAHQLISYDAKSGEKLWWIGGLSWQPKSTPIIDGDTLYAHWWENGGESESVAVTPEFKELLAKFDADKDTRLSKAEVAADAPLTRGFENNDLASDGFLDPRDWDAYRARRASRNSLLAVRPAGARGDLTNSPNVLWRMQKYLPNVPSPLLYEGVLYLIKDGGILTAVDAKSGKMLKQARLAGALDTYYASPVAAAGHVYLMSQPGRMTVIKAGPEWEIVASADFEDEAYATPAIIADRIYVRTRGALYCFGQQGSVK